MNKTELNSLAKAIAHTDWRTDAEKLEHLTVQWRCTKAALTAAQAAHLQSEIDIYDAMKDTLPKKGTTTLACGLKITTGFKESWDQERLFDLNANWHEVSNVPFPFKSEWKPDAKQVAYIRDNLPAVYKKLSSCLTLTEKKPSFTSTIDKE